jgi:hypothetical protein
MGGSADIITDEKIKRIPNSNDVIIQSFPQCFFFIYSSFAFLCFFVEYRMRLKNKREKEKIERVRH